MCISQNYDPNRADQTPLEPTALQIPQTAIGLDERPEGATNNSAEQAETAATSNRPTSLRANTSFNLNLSFYPQKQMGNRSKAEIVFWALDAERHRLTKDLIQQVRFGEEFDEEELEEIELTFGSIAELQAELFMGLHGADLPTMS